MLESLLQLIAERFDLRLGAYDAPAYREELRRNSDHRKLADSLHLVLDCTAAEVAAIEAYLAGLHAAGKVVYGTHRAAGALMTCLVFSLEQSRHVHFIDGADGGYALAALQLKAQLQALVAPPAEPAPRASQSGRSCPEADGGIPADADRCPCPVTGTYLAAEPRGPPRSSRSGR